MKVGMLFSTMSRWLARQWHLPQMIFPDTQIVTTIKAPTRILFGSSRHTTGRSYPWRATTISFRYGQSSEVYIHSPRHSQLLHFTMAETQSETNMTPYISSLFTDRFDDRNGEKYEI